MSLTEAPPNRTPPRVAFSILRQGVWATDDRLRALLRARLALPDESPELRVLQALGLGLLPALLRLGEIRPGAGEAILDGFLARRAREPLRLGLGPALRAHLLASRFGVGRARGGGCGGGSPGGGGGGAASGVVVCAFAGAKARPTTKAAMRRRFMGGTSLAWFCERRASAGSEQCVGADERRLNRSIIKGTRFLANASQSAWSARSLAKH